MAIEIDGDRLVVQGKYVADIAIENLPVVVVS